jgi:predicted phosphodiesterase
MGSSKNQDNLLSIERKRYFMKQTILILLLFLMVNPFAEAWETWTFMITADSRSESHAVNQGVNVPILTELVGEILAKNPDLFLFAGDLVVGNTTQAVLEEEFLQWRQVMQPVYQAGIPVCIVRGNHDGGSSATTTAWNNVFRDETASGGLDYSLPQNGPAGEKNLTYSITHKNALILALDECTTANHGNNYVNQSWIDTQMASNTRPHVFSYGHFTAFKMIWDSLGDHPTQRNAFLQSLENAGSRIYFCGHEHFYHHAVADNDGDPNTRIDQVVVGAAGASVHNWDGNYTGDNGGYELTDIFHTTRFGYILVTITGNDVTLTWMQRDSADQSVQGHYLPQYSWSYTAPSAAFTLREFAALAACWLSMDETGCGDLDFDGDGIVNLIDFQMRLDMWLADS